MKFDNLDKKMRVYETLQDRIVPPEIYLCYWLQRKQGKSVSEATSYLVKKSVGAKNEFLFQNGINFNDLPNWQKRGVGLYWEEFEKTGTNRKTSEPVTFTRRQIVTDMDLPMKDEYAEFVTRILKSCNSEKTVPDPREGN
jgi:tRNA(His) 5'-end guanylyltransferase